MKEIYAVLPEILDASAARVVLELGAHQGEDTRHLRRAFPGAELYSFEPDPRNVEAMRKNGSISETTLLEAAVSDHDGFATFHLSRAELGDAPSWVRDAEYSGSSSLKRSEDVHPWLRFETAVTVPTVTLDTFVRRYGIEHIDVVWADVQGAEDLMIAGGQQALSATSFLFTECMEAKEYEGQIDLGEMLERLPGEWEILRRFPFDVLLRNLAVGREANHR
jgi:FkbM family methyltransferase